MIERSNARVLLAAGSVLVSAACSGVQGTQVPPCSPAQGQGLEPVEASVFNWMTSGPGPRAHESEPVSTVQSDDLEYVGSELWTRAFDAELQGGCLYVSFLNGLGILDVSDERNPRMISKLFLGGGFGLDVHEGVAFVAAGPNGLHLIDVTDPGSPEALGSLQTAGTMKDAVVRNGLLYAADGEAGLAVIDVSDPTSPSLLGSLDTPGSAESVVLRGDVAFLADGYSGVQVVDVSDPADPQSMGSLETGDSAEEIELAGDFAYVANASSGLQVLDVTSPESPRLHAAFPTSGYAKGLTVSGDHVLVGNIYDASLQVIDVSDPAFPSEMADFKYGFPNEPWDVLVEGDRAFIVDYFAGIVIADVSDFSEPETVGWYRTASFFVGLDIESDRAYTLGQEFYGSAALDLADPAAPEVLGRSNFDRTLRFPMGIEVHDHRAFVANAGLLVSDLENPGSPDVEGHVRVPGIARTVRVRGDYAYLTADHSGFYVIDLRGEGEAAIAGVVEMPGSSYGLALRGDHAFLANSEFGLKVLDISDPSEPTLVASMKTPDNAYDIELEGGYAYLADGMAGLHVVDIQNPVNPVTVGTIELGGFVNSVALRGNFAFVTDEDFGVRKIDISDPTSPSLVGSFETPGEPTDVMTYGDYLVVNDAFSVIVLR